MRSLSLRQLLRLSSGSTLFAVATALAGCSSAPVEAPSSSGYVNSNGNSGSGASGSGASAGSSGGSSSAGSGGSSSAGGGGGSTSTGSGSGGSGATSSSSSGGGTSTGAGSSSGGGTMTESTTWTDGTTISTSTTIPAGATVTIAKGATVTVGAGVTITVAGTLSAETNTTHAKLTGTGWTGIVVAAGGTLNLDSVDFTGAADPMAVTGTATYANGTITAPATPIDVEAGGSLTLTTVTITGSTGYSRVNGNLTATALDYDSNGNEGVVIGGTTSVVKITGSTFHGTSVDGGDMISVNACASLTMTYTSITACHCAYHFNEITSFDLENMDLHGDSYGFMMYGSDPTTGTRVFKNSNVETMAAAGIDEAGTNGAITVSGVYFDSSSKLDLTDQEISVTASAKTALPATMVGPQ